VKRNEPTVVAFASALLVAGFLSTDAIVCAQERIIPPGRITGRVVDLAGAILPGVTVKLTRRSVVTRQELTGSDGRFVFDDINPDPAYTLSIELPGFVPDSQEGIAVTEGQTSTVDFAMEIGCVNDLVVTSPYFDRLLTAMSVLHVRTTSDVVERRDNCGPKRVAVVLSVALFLPPGPPAGERILVLQSSGHFEAGKEYLVFVTGPYGRKQPFFRAFLASEIVAGRVRGSSVDDLGVRDGMAVGQAIQHLRDEHKIREKASRDQH
jgi:hypothetical protein